jgi:hypothetical protein
MSSEINTPENHLTAEQVFERRITNIEQNLCESFVEVKTTLKV